MAEALGLASSLIAIASAGVSVVSTLTKFGISFKGSNDKINSLAGRVSLTASILSDIASTVDNNASGFRSKEFRRTWGEVLTSCEDSYKKLEKALRKARKSGDPASKDVKISFSVWGKLVWALGGEDAMKDLETELERCCQQVMMMQQTVQMSVLNMLARRQKLNADENDELRELMGKLDGLLTSLATSGLLSGASPKTPQNIVIDDDASNEDTLVATDDENLTRDVPGLFGTFAIQTTPAKTVRFKSKPLNGKPNKSPPKPSTSATPKEEKKKRSRTSLDAFFEAYYIIPRSVPRNQEKGEVQATRPSTDDYMAIWVDVKKDYRNDGNLREAVRNAKRAEDTFTAWSIAKFPPTVQDVANWLADHRKKNSGEVRWSLVAGTELKYTQESRFRKIPSTSAYIVILRGLTTPVNQTSGAVDSNMDTTSPLARPKMVLYDIKMKTSEGRDSISLGTRLKPTIKQQAFVESGSSEDRSKPSKTPIRHRSSSSPRQRHSYYSIPPREQRPNLEEANYPKMVKAQPRGRPIIVDERPLVRLLAPTSNVEVHQHNAQRRETKTDYRSGIQSRSSAPKTSHAQSSSDPLKTSTYDDNDNFQKTAQKAASRKAASAPLPHLVAKSLEDKAEANQQDSKDARKKGKQISEQSSDQNITSPSLRTQDGRTQPITQGELDAVFFGWGSDASEQGVEERTATADKFAPPSAEPNPLSPAPSLPVPEPSAARVGAPHILPTSSKQTESPRPPVSKNRNRRLSGTVRLANNDSNETQYRRFLPLQGPSISLYQPPLYRRYDEAESQQNYTIAPPPPAPMAMPMPGSQAPRVSYYRVSRHPTMPTGKPQENSTTNTSRPAQEHRRTTSEPIIINSVNERNEVRFERDKARFCKKEEGISEHVRIEVSRPRIVEKRPTSYYAPPPGHRRSNEDDVSFESESVSESSDEGEADEVRGMSSTPASGGVDGENKDVEEIHVSQREAEEMMRRFLATFTTI